MDERDQIFRERLVAVIDDLTRRGRDRPLRRLIGLYSDRLAKEAGARDWADLKERADGPTYDSLLNLFQQQSAEAQKRNDEPAVRAFEVLALSLIARRQYQVELLPGVSLLDRYIEECATNARRVKSQFIETPPARR